MSLKLSSTDSPSPSLSTLFTFVIGIVYIDDLDWNADVLLYFDYEGAGKFALPSDLGRSLQSVLGEYPEADKDS